ncbi:hypothetical protein ACFXPW_17910 [Streptomyces goshikiensis]|uniref:hypothetical protein n=1 Tax=Streptomyces goshikiensis TaxID=1942 RepID=UPI003683BAB5
MKRTRSLAHRTTVVGILLMPLSWPMMTPAHADGVRADGVRADGVQAGVMAPATTRTDFSLTDWMGRLGDDLAGRPLNRIVMPGSHDAGSAGITPDSGMCDAGDSVGASRRWPDLASSMSRTQSGSLVQQLDAGSRYLDLRLCKQGGIWYMYHGGPLGRVFFDVRGPLGVTIPGESTELADWIRRHPQEVVILRVKTTGPQASAAEDAREALTKLAALVGGGAGFPALADSSLKPTSTYGQFMAAGKHVVVVDDTGGGSPYPWAWRQPDVQDYRGSYVGVSSDWDAILKAAFDPGTADKTYNAVLRRGDEVLDKAPGEAAGKFFVQQAMIDPTHSIPNAAMIQILEKLHLVSSWQADNYLISMENELNKRLLAKLRSDWNHTNVTDNMNIVMTDDVNQNRGGVAAGELQREIISKNLPQRVTPHTFHTTARDADGTWTTLAPLSGAGSSFRFVGSRLASAAMTDRTTQLLGIGLDGRIWHDIRRPDGTSQGWRRLPSATNDPAGFPAREVTITGLPDGTAQVAAIGTDGIAYHTIRRADGTWQSWAPVPGSGGAPLKATKIAATGLPNGSAQFLAYGDGGRMRLSTRLTTGTWTGWSTVPGVNAPDFQGSDLAIATLPGGDTQIAAIGNDGNIWNLTRRSSGAWGTWDGPAGISTPMMGATALSVAGMSDGTTQLAAVGLDGNVYHSVRHPGGDWDPLRPVHGLGGANAFAGDRVSITANADGSSRLLVSTR